MPRIFDIRRKNKRIDFSNLIPYSRCLLRAFVWNIVLIVSSFTLFFSVSHAISQDAFESTFDEKIENVDSFLKTYEMTDKKHNQFKKESEDYALADTMLNFTWHAVQDYYKDLPLKNSSDQSINHKELYQKLLEEQRLWVKAGRNAVASSFSRHLKEVDAFTLAIVARTQELASLVYQSPKNGAYLFASTNHLKNPKARLIQGGHVVINTLPESANDEKIILSGQSHAKSGNTCEIYGECLLDVRQVGYSLMEEEYYKDDALPVDLSDTFQEDIGKNFQGTIGGDFQAQLSIEETPHGWMSFYAKSQQNAIFFALFTEHSLYIVDSKACDFCGKDVTFQGLYRLSGDKN